VSYQFFNEKVKVLGAPSVHYVIDMEWNYSILYMHMNMEEVQPYFEKFDKIYWTSREQPTLKQLDYMCDHGLKGGPSLPKWFHQHVIYHLIIFLSQYYFINHVTCVMLCIPSYVVYGGCQCFQ
jgi:hypothetical protein